MILAVVFLVKTGNDIKCVLKSQIIRILAYLFPFVKSNDIIVTAGMVQFCNHMFIAMKFFFRKF